MKRHNFDPISFIAGLFITLFGLVFLIPAEPGDLFGFFGGIDELAAWLWPTAFIAIGLLVILPAVLRERNQSEEAIDAPEGEGDQTL